MKKLSPFLLPIILLLIGKMALAQSGKIAFTEFDLKNGLHVILHQNNSGEPSSSTLKYRLQSAPVDSLALPSISSSRFSVASLSKTGRSNSNALALGGSLEQDLSVVEEEDDSSFADVQSTITKAIDTVPVY